jgi:hypothetical protein
MDTQRETATIYLLMEALPATLDPTTLAANIAAVEGDCGADDMLCTLDIESEDGLYGVVRYLDHAVRLIGIAAPLPRDLWEIQLDNAHLRPEQKPAIAAHRAHIIASYIGSNRNGAEQMIALFKVAHALRAGLVGILSAETWMIQAPEMLPDLLARDILEAFREQPASMLGIWLGYIKYAKEDGSYWLVTRGGQLYGLPDLARHVPHLSDADLASAIFGSILAYAQSSGATIKAGDTLEAEGRQLRAVAPFEFQDYLGAKTLVIEDNPSRTGGGWRGWFGRA